MDKVSKSQTGKIVISLFVFIAILSVLFYVYRAKTYGPSMLQVKTSDDVELNDVVVRYGAAVYIIEGVRTVYSTAKVVQTGEVVSFSNHKVETLPSYFYVSICHPMYKCMVKQMARNEAVSESGEINFGVIRLEELSTVFDDKRYTDEILTTLMKNHLTNIENRYLPVVMSAKAKYEKAKYAIYLLDLCKYVHIQRKIEICGELGVVRIKGLFGDV